MCNKEFDLSRPSSKTKYCSHKCAQQQKSKDTEKFLINCLNCTKEIIVLKGAISKKKYCDWKCKNEYQSILNAGVNNPNYGNDFLKGKLRSEEDIKKIKEGALQCWKTEERKEKQKLFLEKYFNENGFYPLTNPTVKEKVKENYLKNLLDGKFQVKTHGVCGKYISLKTGVEEHYQSSWELIRMQELDADEAVLTWTKKHKICLKLEKKKWYIPDFLIEFEQGIKILEEVKGYVRDKELLSRQIEIAKKYCLENNMNFVLNYMQHLRYGKNKN